MVYGMPSKPCADQDSAFITIFLTSLVVLLLFNFLLEIYICAAYCVQGFVCVACFDRKARHRISHYIITCIQLLKIWFPALIHTLSIVCHTTIIVNYFYLTEYSCVAKAFICQVLNDTSNTSQSFHIL